MRQSSVRRWRVGGEVAIDIRSLVNARGLQLECAGVLHESLLLPVLRYDMEEKERSKIKAVQMDNLRGLLGIRRMDGALNVLIREVCGVTKRLMKVFPYGLVMWREYHRC